MLNANESGFTQIYGFVLQDPMMRKNYLAPNVNPNLN